VPLPTKPQAVGADSGLSRRADYPVSYPIGAESQRACGLPSDMSGSPECRHTRPSWLIPASAPTPHSSPSERARPSTHGGAARRSATSGCRGSRSARAGRSLLTRDAAGRSRCPLIGDLAGRSDRGNFIGEMHVLEPAGHRRLKRRCHRSAEDATTNHGRPGGGNGCPNCRIHRSLRRAQRPLS